MKILLVDDDTGAIQALLATLKTLPGHEVRVATSGGKALENAAAMGGVDVLVTDVVMEPMDGFTLRDQLLARYPRMRTILISGYDLGEYPEQTKGHQFLAKPIDTDALLQAVRTELATAAAPVRPVAAPLAAPVARAVPTAAPRAAAPAPAVSVKATPAAQPRVTARPAGVPPQAAPRAATPTARPAVVAQPVASPAPVARAASAPAAPTAKAAAVGQPRASVQPRATPAQPTATAAQPRVMVAQPHAVPAPPPVAPPPPAETETPPPVADFPEAVPASPESSADFQPSGDGTTESPAQLPPAAEEAPSSRAALVGQLLGTYHVESYLGEGQNGSSYAAVQVSINRRVVLKILDAARQHDDATRRRFAADARAKAAVQHPSILSVYEAGEAAGHVFYAREYVDGQNLAEVQASGAKIPEQAGLKILRVVADGLAYLRANNIPHGPLEAADIYLSRDGQPRLANLAVQISEQPMSVEEEIQALGRIALSVLPSAQQLGIGIRALLGRMVQAPTSGLKTWAMLLAGLKALEPKVVPNAAAAIGAADRATEQAVALARKQQKRSLILNAVSFVSLFAVAIYLVLRMFVFTNERKIQSEVLIPAGTYTLANGKAVTIAEPFSIDTYEVTFADYGRFLEYLEKNPTADQDFRHPLMKRQHTHVPENWSIYYARAKAGKPVASIPIDLNSPVMMVRWWDAYAYAKWRQRELPTAEEWEVAATGGKPQLYPWGPEMNEKKVNSGVDHVRGKPGEKGKIDGYNFWNPVDAISGDKSAFGVVGMAGNVSEWTASWTEDKTSPVIKGGSFRSMEVALDQAITVHDASTPEEWIGFRTIRRNPPAK